MHHSHTATARVRHPPSRSSRGADEKFAGRVQPPDNRRVAYVGDPLPRVRILAVRGTPFQDAAAAYPGSHWQLTAVACRLKISVRSNGKASCSASSEFADGIVPRP